MLYSDIDALCMNRGKATSSKTLHNMAATTVRRESVDNLVIRYHDTDILTFTPSGFVIIRTGGWFTQTTKRRLEDFLNGLTDGHEPAINIQFVGNPWRVVTRRRNPAYTNWDSPEPVWLKIADCPYTEGVAIDLTNGEVINGSMVADYAAYNKAMDKAIIAFVKGITPETFADGETVKMLQTGTLEEAIRTKNYSTQLFQTMLKARGYNTDYIMRAYFWPLVNNDHSEWNSGESKAQWLRREVIGYLRSMLLIGPVPIRKNYGQPRRIA